MLIETEKIENYEYVNVKFIYSEDKEIIDELIKKAKELSDKVSPYDPGKNFRTANTRLKKNIGGLLAEKAFECYLNYLIKNNNLNAKIINITDLQEITVGNQSWNQIDLSIDVNGTVKTIEIRSSFSYKTKFERLFKGAFSLIGWYTHSYKPIEEKKDYYILGIHYYHPDKINDLCKNEVIVHIAGAASKNTLEDKGYNDNLRQAGANFRIIKPLINVPDPVTTIRRLLEIK